MGFLVGSGIRVQGVEGSGYVACMVMTRVVGQKWTTSQMASWFPTYTDGGSPKLGVPFLGIPIKQDYGILGSILRLFYLGNSTRWGLGFRVPKCC